VAEHLPQTKSHGLPDRPEEFGPALAHVIRQEGGQDVVLGQAWMVGANQLITCGHVVDQFVQNPGDLQVHFPASGNRYPVHGIRLHPRFVRQTDHLVKFDAAVLIVDQREASPLPIQFDKSLSPQQALAAVRYPAHLGQLSGAPNPLVQMGRYLGPLSQRDNLHLLHDLALSPGDSGAPIFDGLTVVAIHCGDTATLPGLNLPTTAIRLALSVDALRDMRVSETYFPTRESKMPMTILAAVAAFFLAFLIASYLHVQGAKGQWAVAEPDVAPVDITFNKPPHEFTKDDNLSLTLLPRSNCYMYLFYVDHKGDVLQLFPPVGEKSFVAAKDARIIDRWRGDKLTVDKSPAKLYLVVLKSDKGLLRSSDYKTTKLDSPLNIKGPDLVEVIKEEMAKDSANFYAVLDAPTSHEAEK
jgi:hypothetical protein